VTTFPARLRDLEHEVLPEETARNLKRGIARAARASIQGRWAPSEEAALLDRLQAYTLPVCEALCAGGVQSMDRWVGQLVGHLRDRGLYDRTLIALTSDHGGAVTGGIDVMPTVLDVLGLPRPDQMQGVSLRGLWEGRADLPRLIVSESLSVPHEKKAVRSDKYKPIVSIASEEVGRHGRSFIPERPLDRELYDLVLDPAEGT
jgi:arylsulfatase A-like enzyme